MSRPMHPHGSAASAAPTSPSSIVDSLLHPLAGTIRALLNRVDRLKLGRILIDDEENIAQAIRAGIPLESVFYAGEERLSAGLRERLPPDVEVHEVAVRTCKKLFENDKISRVFAIAKAPPPCGLDALVEGTRDLVVLEDLSISGNVGAILRTSRALGAGGVVLLNVEPGDVYDRRLIRASRGYVFALPVVTAGAEEFFSFCKAERIDLMVTSPHATMKVSDIARIDHRLAVAFGGEKQGCSVALDGAATLRVRIPTDPEVESLNVSAAAAITLFTRVDFNRGERALIGAGTA